MLGFARNPTSEVLDTALARFGFELEESFFSVAVPRAPDRQYLQLQEAAHREYLGLPDPVAAASPAKTLVDISGKVTLRST